MQTPSVVALLATTVLLARVDGSFASKLATNRPSAKVGRLIDGQHDVLLQDVWR